METLQSLIPDPDQVLAMSLPDVAIVLLKLAYHQHGTGMFQPEALTQESIVPGSPSYHFSRKAKVELHLAEVWDWIRQNGFTVPAPGMNGQNGWLHLSSKSRELVAGQDFEALKAAVAFPRHLLHPSIADAVWSALARGDLDNAVSQAFRAVEIAVRDAIGAATSDFGSRLMSKAFEKDTGKLTDMSIDGNEREAMSKFAQGAMGAFRNSHVHRNTGIERQEAFDRVLLASHLLRIVDARAKK